MQQKPHNHSAMRYNVYKHLVKWYSWHFWDKMAPYFQNVWAKQSGFRMNGTSEHRKFVLIQKPYQSRMRSLWFDEKYEAIAIFDVPYFKFLKLIFYILVPLRKPLCLSQGLFISRNYLFSSSASDSESLLVFSWSLSCSCRGSSFSGSDWCIYVHRPPSAKSLTACPVPLRIHLVVKSPSTPTGPRAWIRDVLIPTSAP